MTNAVEFFDMSAAPMRIGAVRLKVCDLGRISAFYQEVLGLSPMDIDDRCITIGNGSSPLLKLEGDPALAPTTRGRPGSSTPPSSCPRAPTSPAGSPTLPSPA